MTTFNKEVSQEIIDKLIQAIDSIEYVELHNKLADAIQQVNFDREEITIHFNVVQFKKDIINLLCR